MKITIILLLIMGSISCSTAFKPIPLGKKYFKESETKTIEIAYKKKKEKINIWSPLSDAVLISGIILREFSYPLIYLYLH